MNKIELVSCLPKVFSSAAVAHSELWLQNITFQRESAYLIKADSGRGKSSFCSYMLGYRNDYEGDILFDGIDVKGFSSDQLAEIRRTNISYLPQGLMLFDDMTAMENITLKNNLTGFKSSEWIANSIDYLGLGERIDFQVKKLSYGQRQRVAFIRALCQPFDFIVLDEPVSHIDDNTALLMTAMLTKELKERGAGLISTSIGKEIPFEYNQIINL